MKLRTKKLKNHNEYICYLTDAAGRNIRAVLGKDLTGTTAKMLDEICFEMVGPATQKSTFVA